MTSCVWVVLGLLGSAWSATASVDNFVIPSGDLHVRVSYEGDEPDSYPLFLALAGNGGWSFMTHEVATRLGIAPSFAVATYNMRGTGDGTTAEL